MERDMKIALVGAGLIGQCHVRSILAVQGAALACIVDPSADGKSFAQSCGAIWYSTTQEMFRKSNIDGAILATPSPLHVAGAHECVANRCPVLVEKPLGIDIAETEKLLNAARSANVPILVGHHRRHGAIVKKAKSIIDQGILGKLASFQGTCWFHKPDDYFDVAWRSEPGGGPIFINLIHDINTALHLFGDVASVQAMKSNVVRKGAAEDTAAILLGFQSGALGTITVSDTAVSPWSWEMTSGENPAFPTTDQACYLIGGTQASLTMPDLALWRHEGARSWTNPIYQDQIPVEQEDPLISQIRQFVAVMRGKEPPLVCGEDGLRTLRVIDAIRTSIATGQSVDPNRGCA